MLYRNGENLIDELTSYLTGKQRVSIFSPYIKSNKLADLLAIEKLNCEQIVVRWQPGDISAGSSDLEIFEICQQRGIALYMNNRIHLKLFTENFEDAIFGSANISNSAISDDQKAFNYEICGYAEKLENDDQLYLQKILNSSILVTEEVVNEISEQLLQHPELEYFDLSRPAKNQSEFLISKLPLVDSPDLLWELHSGKTAPSSTEERNCLWHDVALYDLHLYNSNKKKDWRERLTTNFFSSPFIIEFLKEIDASVETRGGSKREGLRFGAVRKWFSINTTTVPSPRPFELTKNVQILYRWIEDLSDGAYNVSVPGAHSQVIKRNHHT